MKSCTRFAHIAPLLATFAIVSAVHGAEPCQPIVQPTNDGSYVQDHGLDKSGSYCLKEDIFVKGHRSWAEGGRIFNVSKIIVNISANDVVLDFDGHTAWSDGRLDAGIETTLATNRASLKNPPRNITVRNGTLRLDHSGIGIRFSGLGGLYGDKWPGSIASDWGEPKFGSTTTGERLQRATQEAKEQNKDSTEELLRLLPASPAAYPVRNLHIEKMHIRTEGIAVLLQGAGTVIRDSVIEADAGTAIWIYGPGAVIENNTIIVHGRADTNTPLLEADAPIRLHHGDGAIIRNNRIVAKDDAHRRVLSLFDTGDVTVEGNVFEGIGEGDEWAKAFLGSVHIIAKSNRFNAARNWWQPKSKQ